MNGVISVEFVKSQQNLADHLTKSLARDLVHKSVFGMGLKSILFLNGDIPNSPLVINGNQVLLFRRVRRCGVHTRFIFPIDHRRRPKTIADDHPTTVSPPATIAIENHRHRPEPPATITAV
ncbi:hypothetical protein OSB04_019861 [Centaurea solstitialis]|uniref:Uncharacterized protein n=1 Tax=Centaurea solstitialis TaxID=347529 RepID=A0AA38SRM5_9ASTR|nr:hypothetical protein OSB04_019861 [Centaurea solstitialis]